MKYVVSHVISCCFLNMFVIKPSVYFSLELYFTVRLFEGTTRVSACILDSQVFSKTGKCFIKQ